MVRQKDVLYVCFVFYRMHMYKMLHEESGHGFV